MKQVLRLRADAVEWREVEGEVAALDLTSGTYLAINRSGALLWPALVQGTTRERLVELLGDAHGLAPDRAAHDVDAFVNDLAHRGLMESEAA